MGSKRFRTKTKAQVVMKMTAETALAAPALRCMRARVELQAHWVAQVEVHEEWKPRRELNGAVESHPVHDR